MTQIYTKEKLSGSTDGAPITIVGTSSGAANTIHTSVSGTTSGVYDEIWVYAWNTSSSDVVLTLGIDGYTLPPEIKLPAAGTASTDGLKLILPGMILQNSKIVSAFAGTTNVIRVVGYVHKITNA